MIAIINSLPDNRDEDELVEEFLTKLMLEKSKEQFEKEQYLTHEVLKFKENKI